MATPQAWNCLPTAVKLTRYTNTFKRHLESLCLEPPIVNSVHRAHIIVYTLAVECAFGVCVLCPLHNTHTPNAH